MIGTFLVVVLVAEVTEVKEPYGLLISIQQGPPNEHLYLNCNFCSSRGWLGGGLGKRGQPKELVRKRITYKSLRCCLGGRTHPFFSHKGIPFSVRRLVAMCLRCMGMPEESVVERDMAS